MKKISRRNFGRLTAYAAGGLTLPGCSDVLEGVVGPDLPRNVGAAPRLSGSQELLFERVLQRTTFGPRPGDTERIRSIGSDAFIEEQLAPERIEESKSLKRMLGELYSLDADITTLPNYDASMGPETAIRPLLIDLLKLHNFVKPAAAEGLAATELRQASVLRATYSRRQLNEVLVAFWTDHFNVDQRKGTCKWMKTLDDAALRTHAMGRFRDLLSTSARSPAMLVYLDNQLNRRRDPKSGDEANENYARELLELHTLGVNGGYTQQDVREVARCLTGCGVGAAEGRRPGEFTFHRDLHDNGEKHVLGVRIPAGQGEGDLDQVLDILASHPSTARFIAKKLCRRFICDQPPASAVDRAARVFLETDGEIRHVVATILRSAEFRDSQNRKYKRPFEFTVSAMRALDATTDGRGVLPYLESMGHLPFTRPSPDGYPDDAASWATSLLSRWNLVIELIENRIPGTTVRPQRLAQATGTTDAASLVDRLTRSALGRSAPLALLSQLENAEPAPDSIEGLKQCLALILCSPEFQYR